MRYEPRYKDTGYSGNEDYYMVAGSTGDATYVGKFLKEKVHTIAPDPILEECDYKAFAVGLGLLMAIAVFALWLILR